MPIPGIIQPDILAVSETVRLRKFDGHFAFALSWYQNRETLLLVDGRDEPYDMEKLERMYRYLDARGALSFIEVHTPPGFLPIGDVTFWQEDMPIVIGDSSFRGKGIGKQVVAALIERGKVLHYPQLFVREIYHYNIGSQRLFESAGFVKDGKTPDGFRYRLDICESPKERENK